MISGSAALGYNDIGTRIGGTVPTDDVGNLSTAPGFVDPDNGDFHLAGDSLLLRASPLAFGVLDVEGHSYPAGGLEDLGAYEETIFGDEFESLVL